MAKKLSEQLTDLAVRAKHAEDAFTAAQKEAHDKIVVRKQQLLTESGHRDFALDPNETSLPTELTNL